MDAGDYAIENTIYNSVEEPPDAGIFDLKNKTLDELQQEADSHFEKQTSDFDKFWYFLNVTALAKSQLG